MILYAKEQHHVFVDQVENSQERSQFLSTKGTYFMFICNYEREKTDMSGN